MGERVPDAFRFAVKAFQGITHEREGVDGYLRQFGEAVQPLQEQMLKPPRLPKKHLQSSTTTRWDSG